MAQQTGALVVDITGVAATTGGAIAAVPNPEGVAIIVTRAVLERRVKSTGAATADIGVAANATTSADNLLDGVNVAATESVEDNVKNGGTNGLAAKKWGATEYITVTGSATTVGLSGKLRIQYMRADD